MVTCTTPPFRAAVRLNSGVRPVKRTTIPRPIEEREANALEAVLRVAGLSESATHLASTVGSLTVVKSEADSLWFDCPDPDEWYYLLADATGFSQNGEECYVIVRGTAEFISRVEVFNADKDYARFPEIASIKPSGWTLLAPV